MTQEPDTKPTVPGGYSILVVDDTSVVRYAIFRLLSEAGYRVFEAESAVEALEVLATARPAISLVIVDVVMPAIGGVDLARMITERWPGTPVIFMSAYEAQVLVREGLEDPRVIFLGKPFTRDELMKKVSLGLEKRSALRHDPSPGRRPPR